MTLLSNTEDFAVNKVKLASADLEQILKRIYEVANAKTQDELSAVLGIRQSSVSEAKKRKSIPSDWYITLFDKFEVNPNWLRYGCGPKYVRSDNRYAQQNVTSNISIGASEFMSSYLKAVYGHIFNMDFNAATPNESQRTIGQIVLPEAYLRNNISVFCVNTNSLDPFIKKGALVGIDTTKKNPASGEIFASLIPIEGIVLGRLFYDEYQSGFIIKTNHTIYKLKTENIESQILGRMSWVLQNF